MAKLATTPWAPDIKNSSSYFDLLCHTMLPDIAFCLIKKTSRFFSSNETFDDASIEKIMIVTSHYNYKLARVVLGGDE